MGTTALMIAASNADVDLVKLLLQSGADVTQTNSAGKGVLDMLGRTRSHAKLVELWLLYIDTNRRESKPLLK